MVKKRGVISDFLPWLLIGIAVLVILLISVFILRGKGTEFINRIKELFRWR